MYEISFSFSWKIYCIQFGFSIKETDYNDTMTMKKTVRIQHYKRYLQEGRYILYCHSEERLKGIVVNRKENISQVQNLCKSFSCVE